MTRRPAIHALSTHTSPVSLATACIAAAGRCVSLVLVLVLITPSPERDTPQHADRLGFIRQCRSLDMTLDEVRVLLRFKDQPLADCGEVNRLLDEHIGHVAERIKALRDLEKELRALRAACPVPHASSDCGILQGIDHAGATPAAASKRHVRGAH